MSCKDRGMGEPVQWTDTSFTGSELLNILPVEVGDIFEWRSIQVKVISTNPFVVEEMKRDSTQARQKPGFG